MKAAAQVAAPQTDAIDHRKLAIDKRAQGLGAELEIALQQKAAAPSKSQPSAGAIGTSLGRPRWHEVSTGEPGPELGCCAAFFLEGRRC
jgi:hypothetical protein